MVIIFGCDDDSKHLIRHGIHKKNYQIMAQWIGTTKNGRLPI